MTQVDMTAIANLTAAQLAELLAVVRTKEKVMKAEIEALPDHAYLMVMTEGANVLWSGKAADDDSAKALAKAYAEKDGGTVYDMCKRPLPGKRGRPVGYKLQEGKSLLQSSELPMAKKPDTIATTDPVTGDITISDATS